MSKEVIQIDPQLSINLKLAKQKLKEVEAEVEAAESAIYLAGGSNIIEKGTVHLTGVKVTTGFYEKWSQPMLANIFREWKSNLPFPFKSEFKSIAKDVSYLRENAPDAYATLSEALTLTPKKPSFELTGEE